MSEQVSKMRFAVIEKEKIVTIHERPIDSMGDKEVLIKNQACNICTTDYGQWLGLRNHQPFPKAAGHEAAGIIIAKGKDVTEYEIGDHVALGYMSCGECEACKKGITSECEHKPTNWSDDGYYGVFGCADYVVKHVRAIHKMSPDLDPSEAAFVEPLATVMEGQKRLRVVEGETVVVIGAGTMGILNALVAKAYGARVLITEMMDKKIKTAKELGLEVIDINVCNPVEAVKEKTNGRGADAVIVAVGATSANNQALEMVKELRGRILFFAASFPPPELNIDSNTIHYKKLELIGTYSADRESFEKAAEFLSERKVNVGPLVEARYQLDEIEKAYKAAATPGAYRVSVLL